MTFHFLYAVLSREKRLLIINDFFSVCIAGLLMRFISDKILKNKDVVILTHGSELKLFDKQGKLSSIVACKKNYYNALSKSRKLIFPSRYLRDLFEKESSVFINKKSTVIYYGIDTFWLEENDFDINVSESNLKIVTVSRVVESKGFMLMLESLVKASNKGRQITWSILGDGNYLSEMKSKAENGKSSNLSIIFMGKQNRETIKKVLRENDIFMLVPTQPEAFGLAYIEAQSQGLPCIGANHSGIREAINTNTGYLVNDKNELVDVICTYEKHNFCKDNIIYNSSFYDSRKLSEYILEAYKQ